MRLAMIIGILEIKLHAPYVHSLKEKRMIVRSITAKLKKTYNISVCETTEQDIHQIIVIGIAALASHSAACDSILDQIIDYVEEHCEAEIIDIDRTTSQF